MATTKGKMYLGDTLISGGSSIYEYDQTPILVQQFIDEVTYDSSDYTTSQIGNYAPSTADVNNTYPSGVNIDGTTYYNHEPNKYTAILIDDTQSAIVKPTHFLRQIKCSTSNVRDLGGWSCDGGTIKYGKLIRGGEIINADKDLFVNQLGIRQELNLRGLEESNHKTQSPLGSEIGYTCTKNYTWYSLKNEDDWKITLRCVFDSVAHNEPLYFHCSAGADRTGTVACILEAILGVSQSDIDKEYELTCFKTGLSSDGVARRRNETDWQGLINQITALSVGTTFRDKVLNWVVTLGFTVDEINAFRSAMVDGTPSTITLDIDTFSITKTGANVVFDNEETTIAEYQPYKVNIVPNAGSLIKSVTVKMGGVDITNSVFEGNFEPYGTLEIVENGEHNVAEYKTVNVDINTGGSGTLNITENGEYDVSSYANVNVNVESDITYCTVTKTLADSVSTNTQTSVISGQSFGAVITPNDGCEISNITVKMGGADITSSALILIEEV